MKLRPSSYFLIFVLLLMLVVLSVSLTWPYLESKLLFAIISSIVFVLAATSLAKEIRTEDKTAVETKIEEEAEAIVERCRFASALGWIAGFLLAIYLLGFVVATPLFTLSFLKLHGRGWLMAVGYTAIITVLTYVVFELALRASLYRGLIFSW